MSFYPPNPVNSIFNLTFSRAVSNQLIATINQNNSHIAGSNCEQAGVQQHFAATDLLLTGVGSDSIIIHLRVGHCGLTAKLNKGFSSTKVIAGNSGPADAKSR